MEKEFPALTAILVEKVTLEFVIFFSFYFLFSLKLKSFIKHWVSEVWGLNMAHNLCSCLQIQNEILLWILRARSHCTIFFLQLLFFLLEMGYIGVDDVVAVAQCENFHWVMYNTFVVIRRIRKKYTVWWAFTPACYTLLNMYIYNFNIFAVSVLVEKTTL